LGFVGLKSKTHTMNANELRINNWVSRTDGVQIQLSNIGRKGTNIGPDEFPVYIEWHMFEPIPLTPEILEKCGFEKRGKNGYYGNGKGNLLYIDISNNSLLQAGAYDSWAILTTKLQHLHQLQNLYYALTGEELTYNAQ